MYFLGVICVLVFGSFYFRKTIWFLLKCSLFYLCLLSMSVIVVVWSLVTRCGRTTNNYRFFIWGCRNVSAIYGWKYIVTGKRHIQTDDPIIAVVNHQSGLDLLCIAELWGNKPFSNTLIAKHTLSYYGIFGAASYLCNTLSIHRNNLNKAVAQMKSMKEEIICKKLKVFVFPEGRRNRSENLLPFKKGVFHLAVDAQVSIVPIVISSLKPLYHKEEQRLDSGFITMTCLPPVSTRGLSKNDIPELMESVRSSMIKTFNNASKKRNV
eukprot:XP_011450261.1 PREDICTED: 1-acyl-sn-glycerol-3-phosphate acyltransferase alpha-like isoform X1 [Crassostrea gigas]